MAWEIRLTAKAVKQLKKLGKTDQQRIRDFLRIRLAALDDPRTLGKPLKGSQLGSFWRYRVGDYRILCEMHDNELLILVVATAHRKDIYL